jgi:hypothetical protein
MLFGYLPHSDIFLHHITYVNELSPELHLNNIYKSSSYLTGNIYVYYVSATETNRLMLFGETVAVYCENHMEYINTLCGQMQSFLDVKTGGICSYRCDLKSNSSQNEITAIAFEPFLKPCSCHHG